MKFVFVLSLVLGVASYSASLCAQEAADVRAEIHAILKAQDERDMTPQKLESWMRHPDAKIRSHASLACASMQDSTHAEILHRGLNDPDREVRCSIAYALGQIGAIISVEPMIERLRNERSKDVRRRLFEALGKCIQREKLDALWLEENTFLLFDLEGLSHFFARCAIRGIASEKFLPFLEAMLQPTSPHTLRNAIYALARFRNAGWSTKFVQPLVTLCSHKSPEVRMFAATAIGYAKDSAQFHAALSKTIIDRDWRVRVNALRSVIQTKNGLEKNLAGKIIRSVTAKETHSAVTALQVCSQRVDINASLRNQDVSKTLKSLIQNEKNEMVVRSEAALALAKIYPDTSADFLLSMIEQSTGNTRELFIEALGFVTQKNIISILHRIGTQENTPQTQMAVLKAMRAHVASSSQEDRSLILQFHVQCLQRSDLALVTQAAEQCLDSAIIYLDKREILRAAAVALEKLTQPTEVEAIVALCNLFAAHGDRTYAESIRAKLSMDDRVIVASAAEAMQKITGEDFSAYRKKKFNPRRVLDPVEENLAHASGKNIIITTTKGKIELQLDARQTPFTVLNILSLIENKFYDGLRFHRVVPNFVIQGGDPRGDGWGGPGWTMRSEFGLNDFMRGSVGIASAGKDTEGSQFFITHCPTPHLDGRYTCFGKVVKGMDVVDRIQIGDKIISIRLR